MIGQMDRLITVYKYQAPTTAGTEATYRKSRPHWMGRKPLRADEKYSAEANQRYADVAVRFTSHPIKGLSLLDVLKDEQGQFWDVRAIMEIGYNKAIEIDATLRSSAPLIDEPAPPPPAGISFTITAGQDTDWIGYTAAFGSISAQPIAGASIVSVVAGKAIVGEGGLEISGTGLSAILDGLDVWLDGVKIPNPAGWTFSSTGALWWVFDGFPEIEVGKTYMIELK